MKLTRTIDEIIKYPPLKLNEFEVVMYEWVDNLNFTIDPTIHLKDADKYLEIAKAIFLESGWAGDGEIRLMCIPPFMFKGKRTEEFTNGVVVWHVKQKEDGLSWILSPIKLPCQTEFV